MASSRGTITIRIDQLYYDAPGSVLIELVLPPRICYFISGRATLPMPSLPRRCFAFIVDVQSCVIPSTNR